MIKRMVRFMYRFRFKTIFLIFLTCTFFVLLSSCESSANPDETVTVTFDYNDGEKPVVETISKNTRVSKPKKKEREHLIFEGWYKDSEYEKEFKFSKKVNESITLYAKYTIDYDDVSKRIDDGELKSHVGIKITYFNRFMSSYSWGSGVVIEITDSKVYILSNSHLSKKNHGLSNIKFQLYDYLDNSAPAKLVFENSEYDLAVFECEKTTDNFEVIDYGQSHRVNEEIVSIGRPLGNPNNVTFGVIKGDVLGPKLTCARSESNVHFEVIKHDSYINLGSSGGALLNLDLELIGIQYAVTQDEETHEFKSGYAIPLYKVYDFLELYEQFKLTNA